MVLVDKIESALHVHQKNGDNLANDPTQPRAVDFPPPPKKAIIALTSARAKLYEDGGESGMFVSEALHPFLALKKAGFSVEFTSETGGYHPDSMSLKSEWLTDEERAVFDDRGSEFRLLLDNMIQADKLAATDYGLFFASAGHAALLDYPTARNLQALAAGIYYGGGICAAVCHGPALFADLKLPTGGLLAKERRITAFTDKGEEEMELMAVFRDEWKVKTCEEIAAQVGATYVAPKGPFDEFVVDDGRLITGVNPQSAKATAEAAIKAWGKTQE